MIHYKHILFLLGLMMLARNWQIYNIVNDLYSIYSFSDKHDTKIDKIFIKINKLDKYQSIKKIIYDKYSNQNSKYINIDVDFEILIY